MGINSFLKLNIFLITLTLILGSKNIYSQKDTSELRLTDKVRIAEAVRMSDEFGDNVWSNFNQTLFALLLVINENEYLFYHPSPSEDFLSIGFDSITGCEIFVRERIFSNNMLATFPAVNGVSTIVVGQPENTSRSSLDWTVTLLHEHFHQMQSSLPDYYESVNSLDLSGGDETGMWMLNYDFPYDDQSISDQYSKLIKSAMNTYLSDDSVIFNVNLKKYIGEREKFKSLLNENDYRYFSFQLWQEGIARYTEIKFTKILKDEYSPTESFKELSDYISIDSFYVNIINKLLKSADTQILSFDKRNCFYTLGALEGLIIDKTNHDWKDKYFTEKFFMENYFNIY